MPLFLHAATADEAQQEEAIGGMPAAWYHIVGAPRLAFIGITSLHHQLARLVRTFADPLPSGSNGPGTGPETGRHVTVAVRPANTHQPTTGLSPMTAKEWSVLLKSCCGLLQVADRLMLQSEDMFREPPMKTWGRVSPMRLQPDVRGAAQGLFDLLLHTLGTDGTLAHSMLHSLRYKHQEYQSFVEDAYLFDESRMHITMMMAITFASVVCCGCVMDKHSSAAPDAQAQTSMRNDLLVMAALHHAVSTGWEFMLWQICGPLSMDHR
eukprot:jgi/Ulvmu1/8025/UM004_0262.1